MTSLPLVLHCSMSNAATSLPHPADILPWKWRTTRLPSPHHVVLPPFKQLDVQAVSGSPPPPAYEHIFASTSRQPSPDPPPSPPARQFDSPPQTTRNHQDSFRRMSSSRWYEAETPAPVVAEKTAEMVCYLWFSSNRDLVRAAAMRSKSRSRHSPTITKIDPALAALQFSASQRFVQYIRKILETTQVSQSVIVLSLHYIFRLRQQNGMTAAQEGSEFRVAVVALMLANKFVDDNTYTNKTWSEVAGIDLTELNRMEREFLLGIDSRLYVDKATYDSWLQLLKGLVLAKEKERQYWRVGSRRHKETIIQHSPIPQYPGANASAPSFAPSYRPRSSSPVRTIRPQNTAFTFTLPRIRTEISGSMDVDPSYNALVGKRSAVTAFEDLPTLGRPSKRAMVLQTDGLSGAAGPRSAGPAFTSSATNTPYTDAFARLSISNNSYVRNDRLQPNATYHPSPRTPPRPNENQILAQPYNLDHRSINTQPQHLYFYTLAGSPLDTTLNTENRKAKLHYAPRQSPLTYTSHSLHVPAPLVVQSAAASPRDMPLRMVRPSTGITIESSIARPLDAPRYYDSTRPHCMLPPLSHSPAPHPCPRSSTSVPAAHFANAGPPGVHWTATTPVENAIDVHYRGRRF